MITRELLDTLGQCRYPECSNPGSTIWPDGFVTCSECTDARLQFNREVRAGTEKARRARVQKDKARARYLKAVEEVQKARAARDAAIERLAMAHGTADDLWHEWHRVDAAGAENHDPSFI